MTRTFQFRIGDDERTVAIKADSEQYSDRVGERVFVIAAQSGEAGQLDRCVDGARRRAYDEHQVDLAYV